MKKSWLLTAVPALVNTAIGPECAPKGAVVPRVVEVAVVTVASVGLNRTALLAGVVSKLVPVIVTAVPTLPMVGVKLLIVGAPRGALVTVKFVLLVAEPEGLVTPIGPVVAPDGTVETICVAVDDVTVAVTPLKVTVFWLGVVLNPVP